MDMVEKYLEKYYNLLLEKKVDLEENLELHRTKLEKYSNRIEKLKNDTSESLLGFSPHIVDVDESEKTDKYQTLVDSCKKEIDIIENSIYEVKEEIKQLISEIKDYKEEKRKKINDKRKTEIDNKKVTNDILLSFSNLIKISEYEKCNTKNIICDNIIQKINSIKNRLSLSSNIVNVDPVRCKIELNVISKIMEQICFDMNESLYGLNSIILDEEEKVELMVSRIFDNLEKAANYSVSFSFYVDESLDNIFFVMKYQIVYLVNTLCFILMNEFHAEKMDMKICKQDEKICITVKYIGDKFSLDNASSTDSLIDMKDNALKNVDSFFILKKELEVLSAKILESDFENDENIISIVFPLDIKY